MTRFLSVLATIGLSAIFCIGGGLLIAVLIAIDHKDRKIMEEEKPHDL